MAFTDATETVVTYNLNGSQREFNIPFDYLSRAFVQVTVFGESEDKRLVVGTDYNYLDARTIATVQALGGSDGWQRIQLRRYTSDDRIVDFKDGSVLKSADLNVAVVQALHIAAEGRDGKFDLMGVNSEGNWDALDRKITRMAAGTERRDAVNLGQMQDWSASALNQADRAKREADRSDAAANRAQASETAAKNSQTAAKTSETNAKTSETNSYSHMVEAGKSQTAAKTSETNAKTSETNAKTSEVSAKADGQRAYSEAERAKGYADSMGNAIDIGGTIRQIQGVDVQWKGAHYTTQYLGVRGDLGNWGGVGINLEARVGGSPTIAVVKDGNWRYYGFNMELGGTLATQEFVNKYVGATIGGGSQLQTNGGVNVLAVNNNGNCGAWDTTNGRWMLRVNTTGAMDISKDVYQRNTDQGASSTKIELVSPDSNKHVGLWAYNDGRILLSSNHPASGWSNISLGGVGNGTIALREWVSTNFSNGTKLGGLVTGTRVSMRREDGVTGTELQQLLKQIPDNGVFCGVEEGSNGQYLTLAPRWRIITKL